MFLHRQMKRGQAESRERNRSWEKSEETCRRRSVEEMCGLYLQLYAHLQTQVEQWKQWHAVAWKQTELSLDSLSPCYCRNGVKDHMAALSWGHESLQNLNVCMCVCVYSHLILFHYCDAQGKPSESHDRQQEVRHINLLHINRMASPEFMPADSHSSLYGASILSTSAWYECRAAAASGPASVVPPSRHFSSFFFFFYHWLRLHAQVWT